MKNKIILCTLLAASSNVFAVRTAIAVAGTGIATIAGYKFGNSDVMRGVVQGLDVSAKENNSLRERADLANEGFEDGTFALVGALEGMLMAGIILGRRTPGIRHAKAAKHWAKLLASGKTGNAFQIRAVKIDSDVRRAAADYTEYGLKKHGMGLHSLIDDISERRRYDDLATRPGSDNGFEG